MNHDISTDTKHDVLPKKGSFSNKTWAGIVYLLQALSLGIGGLSLIIGVVINYVKKSDVKDTWLESHFDFQIKTFWFSALLIVFGLLTFRYTIGYFALIAAAFFIVYRVVKGWLRLNGDREVENSSGFSA